MYKPYLEYNQQIQKLVSQKGLVISDFDYARQKLIDIGYFSLIGGYKTPFINPMTRKYETLTKFEVIVALYQFDKNLRQLTFGYLTDIEQKIRQLISDSFCSFYGEQQTAYLSPSSYTSAPTHQRAVSKLISILDKLANRDNDHAYIVHQRNTYHNVPLWVLTKALTFGQLSKMYSLLNFRQQSNVSKAYPFVSENELARYLNALTFFRNVCAHNERLYCHRLVQQDFPDKTLHAKLRIAKRGNQYLQGKNDYFGLLISFRYLLLKEDFNIYKKNLRNIIKSYLGNSHRLPETDLLNIMGFPSNWNHITRYRV